MSRITITCPHCGLTKDLPAEKVPSVRIRVTCPRCRGTFAFTKPAETADTGIEPARSPEIPSTGQQEHRQPPRQSTHVSAPCFLPKTKEGLTGIGDLLGEAWTVFQRRFGTLFCLFLLTVVFTVLPPVVIAAGGHFLGAALPAGKGMLLPLSVILGTVSGFVGMFRGLGAFIAAVTDESLAIRESLARGKARFFPFLWVCTLTGFILTGSFLLFIIPGIILSIWFFFAQFITMDDETGGMDALLKSREYVRGHGFAVFLRFLVIWAASTLIGLVPFVGPIVSLLAMPYVMIFYCLIYRDLKRIKGGDVMYSCSTGDKVKWLAVAALGYIAVPVIIFSVFGASLSSSIFLLKAMMGQKGQTIVIPPPNNGEGFNIPQPQPVPGQGSPQTPEGQPVTSVDPSSHGTAHQDLHVFIYAVNYTGKILVNGQELQVLEGKRDMQYNYNLGGDKFRPGKNVIEVEYAPLPDITTSSLRKIEIRVGPFGSGEPLGDWVIDDAAAGRKSFDLEIPG